MAAAHPAWAQMAHAANCQPWVRRPHTFSAAEFNPFIVRPPPPKVGIEVLKDVFLGNGNR